MIISIKPELELLRFKLLVDWQAVKLSFKKDRLSKQGPCWFFNLISATTTFVFRRQVFLTAHDMSLNYLPFSLLDFVQYSFLQIFLLLLYLMTNRFHDRHSYLPFILLFVWSNFVWKNKREVVEMIDQPQGHCLPNFEKYQKT